MYKKFIATLVLCLPFQFVLAQNTTLFQTPKKNTTPSPSAPIPPDDFANQVKSINTQNHTQFKQQLDQKLSTLSRPGIPSLSDIQNTSQTPLPPPAEEAATKDRLVQPTKKATTPLPAPVNPAPSMEQPMSAEAPTMPASAPAAQTAPSSSSSQPYTGFSSPGTSGGGTQQQQQKSNSGGGFNIQY